MGHLIDTTCILWQMTCGSTGACLLYNTIALRYLIHGFTVMIVSVDLGLLTSVACILKRQGRNKKPEHVNTLTTAQCSNNEAKSLVEAEEVKYITTVDEALRSVSYSELDDDTSHERQPLKFRSNALTEAKTVLDT